MNEDWRLKALCHRKNNVFWYPPLEEDSPEQYYSIAREVCKNCAMWELCLDDSKDEKWGMWAGLTPKDRQNVSSNKTSLLKSHGTWLRYRQGCRCDECTTAHSEETKEVSINMSLIPKLNEPVEDISSLRFRLLG